MRSAGKNQNTPDNNIAVSRIHFGSTRQDWDMDQFV